jgi:putative ABC transport system substrate-binding protein
MNEVGGNPIYRALLRELRQLGYVEGQNLSVGRYSGQGREERYPELAGEVIDSKPDVIFVVTVRLALHFKSATASIPVVVYGGDPIALGLVSSLARPGGNITGVALDAGVEIEGKRLELLREAVPRASKVAYLAPRSMWESRYGTESREVAQRMGVSLLSAALENPIQETEYRRAFSSMTKEQVDALLVADTEENFSYRRLIVELADKARLPGFYPFREFVELGGLLTYAIDLSDQGRRAANYIDRIFKGTKPGDIPFWQPIKFELVINLKTAKALGLDLSPMLLARADEVID